MQIRLDQLDDESYEWSEAVDVPASRLERTEVNALGLIEWRGRLLRADPGFYLTARAAYAQTLVCDRCLAEVTEPVEASVELLVLVEPSVEEPGEVELSEDELGVLKLAEPVLDLEPLLQEQLQLGVPMKPLCRAECKGLCPRCGSDLNDGTCECVKEEVDPRWSALAALREDREEENR